jgi:hypothetical protein
LERKSSAERKSPPPKLVAITCAVGRSRNIRSFELVASYNVHGTSMMPKSNATGKGLLWL